MSKRPLGYWTHKKPLSMTKRNVRLRANRARKLRAKLKQFIAEHPPRGKT